jgi:endonuclease YncB( thermonuclease family)
MPRRLRFISLALIAALAALGVGCTSAAAPTIVGHAKVVDGDSLEIGTTRVRLFGVDAPEGKQSCRRDGRPWRCGEEAAAKLRALVRDVELRCVQRDVDDYGRSVAVCRSGGTDINAEMVRAGLALAYRHYSNDYVDEEAAARDAHRGLWAGEFTPPWEWRRESHDEPPAARPAPSPSSVTSHGTTVGREPPNPRCAVKGNISQSTGERIYHVPGSRDYAGTVIDERVGERWFCSEAEARRAGWRAPREAHR